jgi:HlyD family secretion protein
MIRGAKRVLMVLTISAIASGGIYASERLKQGSLPEGIAAGDGRIEGVEISIATKIPGQIAEILADEGDFVTAGQVLAYMDTENLQARYREADAQSRRAVLGVGTAQRLVALREAERTVVVAEVEEREALLDAATQSLARTEPFAKAIAQQTLDKERAAVHAATTAVAAAKAQVAATELAISTAKSQVVDAEVAVEAARATIQRIKADIDGSTLRSPRGGRVESRAAQPSEVLPAGGRVLNLVDPSDVHMTFYLTAEQAEHVALGAEARIILDAAPSYVIPAKISFVSDVAQLTPKTVKTGAEHQKPMFLIKARIAPELLRKYFRQVQTGLSGTAYVRLYPEAEWPSVFTARS